MPILVTGGAGFIGSHLVDRLLDLGHEVRVLDDLSTGRPENLAHRAGDSGMSFVRGTILDEHLVREMMDGCLAVYHLAATVGVKHVIDDPLKTIRTLAGGTDVVLSAATEAGARVVFASTSEIYGKSTAIPYREDGPRVLGATWSQRWSYSTAKALDEHLCFAFGARGLRVSIVRYFNVYGPRMAPDGYGGVVARFVKQSLEGSPLTVHGDGQQKRCFTFVSEAVEATLRAGSLDTAEGQAINVGSDFEHTINDVAELVLSSTGSSSNIKHVPYEQIYGEGFEDARRRKPDVSKAKRLLDWRAEIPLVQGLRAVIDTWRERAAAEAG